MSDELERRIEILENDVATLTDALRSALEWKVGDNSLRQKDRPSAGLLIAGQGSTKEILDQLP